MNLKNLKEIEELEEIPFGSIAIGDSENAKEEHLENLIAENIGLIESAIEDDESPTLLIIGRQVRTTTGRRMDLVAIDGTGRLILIEVKRDAADVKSRLDHAEIQSVRYAASLARLRTADELVANVYGPYIAKFCQAELDEEGGDRTAEEWARKKLFAFLRDNEIDEKHLNDQQLIVLIGASFDEDTRSAAAWMASNGLPLRVIEVRPVLMDNQYLLDVKQIIPVPQYEDFYVDLVSLGSKPKSAGTSNISRRKRIRLDALMEHGRVNKGDLVYFKNEPQDKATLQSSNRCTFEGQTYSVFEWAKKMSTWSSVNIYEWLVHVPTGKTLEEIRVELESELEEKAAAEQQEQAAQDESAPTGEKHPIPLSE